MSVILAVVGVLLLAAVAFVLLFIARRRRRKKSGAHSSVELDAETDMMGEGSFDYETEGSDTTLENWNPMNSSDGAEVGLFEKGFDLEETLFV
jgi:hypothetical protein